MVELSVILPVHNEAGVITKTIKDIEKVLRLAKISHEFICVENGSTDDTLQIVKSLTRKYPLKVITSELGWGNAVKAGISQATGKLTCYTVSDGQVEAKYIVGLYHNYLNQKQFSLFKIWRTKRENQTRLINSRSFNLISHLVFGIDSRDINATPKLLDTKLLKSVPLTANNIAIDLELLLKLKKRGLTWQEIPAPSLKRDLGESTTKLKTVWEMIAWIIKFKFTNYL
jgi:dolichol-phosphate mannosyltransferase